MKNWNRLQKNSSKNWREKQQDNIIPPLLVCPGDVPQRPPSVPDHLQIQRNAAFDDDYDNECDDECDDDDDDERATTSRTNASQNPNACKNTPLHLLETLGNQFFSLFAQFLALKEHKTDDDVPNFK